MLCLNLVPSQKTVIYLPGGEQITLYGPKRSRASIQIDAPKHIEIKRLPRDNKEPSNE